MHKVISREDNGKESSKVFPASDLPPLGCVDVLIVEACNLKAPHNFSTIFDFSGVSAFAVVELVGGRALRQRSLHTSVMNRGKLDPYK